MNKRTLEFITFAIGSIAEHTHKSPAEVYQLMKEANIIESYLIPGYDFLHTFSRKYIVEDILDLMQEKGVKLC